MTSQKRIFFRERARARIQGSNRARSRKRSRQRKHLDLSQLKNASLRSFFNGLCPGQGLGRKFFNAVKEGVFYPC